MNQQSGFRLARWATVLTLLLAVAALPATASQHECIGGDRVRDVTAWGRPATTFSPYPARSLGELKDLFNRYESDLRTVLGRAGWEGNPDDLFRTVRMAEEGSPLVTVKQVAPGAEFAWMAFRRKGQPACVKDIRWAGKSTFPAWSITVVSNDVEYVFMVPQECLNLAAEKGRKPVPPPTCDLKASFDPEADAITVTGTTNGASIEVTKITTPAGAGKLGDLKPLNGGRWSYPVSADGTYSFEARATSASGRQSSTCSASVPVTRKKPVCTISASVDPDTQVITVSTAGSVGSAEITGFKMWDGSSGEMSALQSAGAGKWTFAAGPTLPKKPGDYTFTFDAISRLHGYEATCSAGATLTKERRRGQWIVRGYAARVDSSGDEFNTVTPAVGDFPEERTKFSIGNATGFGGAVEYLFRPNWGVELDAMLADLDTMFVFDIGPLWGMDHQDVDFQPISLGINYHLTPDKRADVFLGAFVSAVDYGDATYSDLDLSFRNDLGSDTGFGAKVGVDIPFSWESPWAITGSLRYIATSAEVDNVDLDVDPLIFTLGLAYKF